MDTSTRDRMQADLLAAMKAKDAVRVSVLRATLAAIANAEAVDAVPVTSRVSEVDRRDLSDADIHAIIATHRLELQSASEEMRALGQTGEAENMAAQAVVLTSYVP